MIANWNQPDASCTTSMPVASSEKMHRSCERSENVLVVNGRTRKPRLLFLNRSYWPDTEATGQLLADLAEGLTDEFDVSVVCGQPNAIAEDVVFQKSGISKRNDVTIYRLRHTHFPKRTMGGKF